MVKLISFIVLTHFFQFNELKILMQPGYLLFKLNHPYFFTVQGWATSVLEAHCPIELQP